MKKQELTLFYVNIKIDGGNEVKQIIALGGGGFSMEPENPLLDKYILKCSSKARPAVCFVPTASGDGPEYVRRFYESFNQFNCEPSHLALFRPHTSDIEGFVLEQDIIYVGGGSTKNLLALWREWKLDSILKIALANGVILAGISAGAICWFEQGLTDSLFGSLTRLDCLGFLKGSCSPHYDGEAERRPRYHALIASGEMISGIAADDGAALHYIDGKLSRVISSRPDAAAYLVKRNGNCAEETRLETSLLKGL